MTFPSVTMDMNIYGTINPPAVIIDRESSFTLNMLAVRASLCQDSSPPFQLVAAELPVLIESWNVLFPSARFATLQHELLLPATHADGVLLLLLVSSKSRGKKETMLSKMCSEQFHVFLLLTKKSN